MNTPMPSSARAYHTFTVEAALQDLSSNASSGISRQEAQRRLKEYGPNQLQESKPVSPWVLFAGQFADFIVWVLMAAAIVSGFLGEWIDAGAIVGIVIINAILGFIQEYRAEKSLAALKKLFNPSSRVIREGEHSVVLSSLLVPGDIVELEAGDHIPADCRLLQITPNFTTQESSLTGESNPVNKQLAPLTAERIPLADRITMVYMGTAVAGGKAKALVVATGMHTELGNIAGMIQQAGREDTPLQKKLEEFGKWIVYACFVLVALVFVMEWARGGALIDTFLTAVSLAVAAIPEGLPAVVTIALALGVQRMVKRHALIRRLPSVETLGCATVICSDKTGTLTKNEMTVQSMYADGRLFEVTGVGYAPQGSFMSGAQVYQADTGSLGTTLMCGLLCNGARLFNRAGSWQIIGDPTEAALLTVAAKAGFDRGQLEEKFSFVQEVPFDSVRKKMSIIRRAPDGAITAYTKGAPDIFLADCVSIEEQGIVRPLTEEDRARITAMNNELAGRAMRVLAFGYKTIPESAVYDESVERGMVFAGLAAMIDPPRAEVKEAMKICASSGIRPVMITGDHKNTAAAIARALGFFKDDSLAITGEELDAMSSQQFAESIERISVYARVSPEHKLRIVKAWRAKGHVVAMTGDGVNDAPAVKEADIGIAMGIAGTDVTKEVSDMVVTDDNFASIVAAVEEGRGIYDNIKKFIHYLLSCNTGEILTMFTASLLGMPVPLLPIHILWVNLVTDGLPALALGVDPVDPLVMKKPPRSSTEPVITRQAAITMVIQGACIAACSLAAFWFVYFFEKEGIERARTMAFVVLSCSQLFHAFNCRSATESLFTLGVWTNKKLVAAACISFCLSMLVVYLPFANVIFKTLPLGVFDWVAAISISSLPLWVMECVKFFNKQKTNIA